MNKIIFNNIYEDILEISRRELQEELWLGKNPEKCSSYTEVMCRLFDDNNFENFINFSVYEIGFSPQLIEKLKLLSIKLDNYRELIDDEKIINDPKWEEIREVAKKVIALWNKDESIID